MNEDTALAILCRYFQSSFPLEEESRQAWALEGQSLIFSHLK